MTCRDCGTVFHVPRSQGGGLANCPGCRRLVEVPAAGPEPLFLLLVGGGALAVLIAAFVAWQAAGWVAGLIALGVGAGVIAGVVAAS